MPGEEREAQAHLSPRHRLRGTGENYTGVGVERRCWKHSRQYTGRPCVGLKGTVVSLPHCEQVVVVSTRWWPGPLSIWPRLDLQGLHRFGSFLKPLSAKKSCSPAVKINSAPQSMHLRALSRYSMSHPVARTGPHPPSSRPVGMTRFWFDLAPTGSVLFVSGLLACPFSSQGCLDPLFLPRFQIEGVLLNLLDDIFLLNLALEATQRVFEGFTLLKPYFSQPINTPIS